jgi:chaperonin GroES
MELSVKQNYVLVEPISMKNKQVGMIVVLEDVEDKKVQRGKILAIGDGVMPDGKTQPLTVKVGETVVYAHNTGHSTKMDHKEYLLMREDEILAVLE